MGITHRILEWLSAPFASQDGLDLTDYVRHIEREFEVQIREDDAGSIATLGDMCDYVVRQLRQQGRSVSNDQIWSALRRITSEEFGVDSAELHQNIRYFEDLNC